MQNRDELRRPPTPAEIAAETAAIRKSWSDQEHHQRAGIEQKPVEVRRVRSTGREPSE